jgi:ectoine hydroxylase-related dioxygenase (phytanoyl-CoA dioxygenase family)
VWLALDPWTIENGCLRVIPGSHRGRRLCDQMTEDRNRRNDFRVGHRPELATG